MKLCTTGMVEVEVAVVQIVRLDVVVADSSVSVGPVRERRTG